MAFRGLAVLFYFCSWGFAGLILAEVFCFWIDEARIVNGLEVIIGPICHHLPERTFEHPTTACHFPVCARCTGLYIGWFLGLSIGVGFRLWRPGCAKVLEQFFITLLGLAALALLAAISEGIGLFSTKNMTRFFLGLPLGILPAFMLIVASTLLSSSASRQTA